VDFGDGSDSGWMAQTPAISVSADISHSYSTAGTMTVVSFSKDDSGNESVASISALTVSVANAEPVAILRAVPSLVRAGQVVRLDGSQSFDVDAGGTTTNYVFTPGDGSTAIGPQAQAYADHTYANAGEYSATLTCEDAVGTGSNTSTAIVKVIAPTLVVPLTLNTFPSSFSRNRLADYVRTPVLDATYPEVSDSGQRSDEFTLEGAFLKSTADVDILFMEDLLESGVLVEMEYQSVNFTGTPDSKTFIGRMVSFDYSREGGNHGQTPWSATLIREAGMGA
jgi:hypothetical protein